jgi:CheY-like chemotaxis protein
MMTGYLIPETIQKGIQRGADEFIAKPFTPEELIKSVHLAVSAAKGR